MEKIITKKDVQSKLIESLINLVEKDGFKLNKKDNMVIRKTTTGFESFTFGILNYWPYCIEITGVSFSIRFNAVEEIIIPIEAKNGLRAGMEFFKSSTTHHDGITYEKKIFNENDLNNFITTHIDKIKEKGISFFAKYKDNVFDVNIYYKDIKINRDNIITIGTIMRSLTLMKLSNDKDFDEMKIKYRQILKPLSGMERETFGAYDDLVEYLSNL